MCSSLKVKANDDGTATASVKGQERTFPDMHSAVEWATSVLYDLPTKDDSDG